jgi:hypothetical protein
MASGFLCALGASIRCIAAKTYPPSYILTMIGQVVGGSASPLALNIMTMVRLLYIDRIRIYLFI